MWSDTVESLGTRLKGLREDRGLNTEDLAEALNFTKSIIWSYELGKKEPSLSHIKRISDYYNVPVDYLLISDKKLSLELQDENAMSSYALTVDDIEVSNQELLDTITFIKTKRSLNNGETSISKE